ncbi:hypothetical protein V6N11_006331 [Hibiscus sabdariffa]|uniref:F-box domain-containing protein n=1 Tax=Hibiscus sabdariffa TaxID=183260 RepID=A0ABR2RR12_9ROSI
MATLPVPGDLIPEILSRLGVQDLLRFRCVSKQWCSLIDDPDFIKLHLSRSRKTDTHFSLVFKVCHLIPVDLNSFVIPPMLNHPFSDEAFCTEALGSCNGLLALHNGEQDIVLWNPLKRKSHMLPFNEIKFPPYFCFLQFIVYGFGHDPISDDYKLVRMVQFDGRDDDSFGSEVKVYSLRTNSWRRIKDFPFYLYKRADGYLQGECGVLANNALHWVVSKKPKSDTRSFVVAFDIGTEEYRVVELPDCLDQGFRMNVKSLDGSLCLIANYCEIHVVDIWMMKEYGVKESWTKLVSFNQSKPFDFVLPLAFSKNGDQVLLNIDGNEVVWCDLRSKRVEKTRFRCLSGAHMLVESLVPLNDNDAVINKKVMARKRRREMVRKSRKKKNTKRFRFRVWNIEKAGKSE